MRQGDKRVLESNKRLLTFFGHFALNIMKKYPMALET